jgi:drug/metabolite transporter (DMT)-like permease
MALVYLKLFLTALFWGGMYIAGRIVVEDAGAFSVAFLRFFIASILLLAMTWKTEGGLTRPSKGQMFLLFCLGMTGIFSYNFFMFSGLRVVYAGRAALIMATNPVFIALFSARLFNENLNLPKISGIIMSVTGAAVVISRGQFSQTLSGALGWGELYMFCAVFSWVAYSLMGKVVMKELSPLVSVSYSSVVGTLALFLPACMEGMMLDLAKYSAKDWLCFLYLGLFCTVLGILWYYEGIRHIGATKASQFINFVPICAILLASFMLGEPITSSLAVGAILVFCGVYLMNRAYPRMS